MGGLRRFERVMGAIGSNGTAASSMRSQTVRFRSLLTALCGGFSGEVRGLGRSHCCADQRRTATVTTLGPVTVYALGAVAVLAALSGHSLTRRRVDALATSLGVVIP